MDGFFLSLFSFFLHSCKHQTAIKTFPVLLTYKTSWLQLFYFPFFHHSFILSFIHLCVVSQYFFIFSFFFILSFLHSCILSFLISFLHSFIFSFISSFIHKTKTWLFSQLSFSKSWLRSLCKLNSQVCLSSCLRSLKSEWQYGSSPPEGCLGTSV